MSEKTENLLRQAKSDENHSSISCAEETFSGDAEAARVFSILKTKILQIAEWNEHALLSTYKLFDESGETLPDEKLSVGTFIRVSLTGSGKYDWIKIIDIYETENEFVITVKPTYDPTAGKPDAAVISHFFTDESTNNFCLWKKNNTVAFYVIGLSEKQNTSETGNIVQTVRNVAVSFGSYLGIQKSEWEKFCHHFLEAAAQKEE